jgi:hypothetical protein
MSKVSSRAWTDVGLQRNVNRTLDEAEIHRDTAATIREPVQPIGAAKRCMSRLKLRFSGKKNRNLTKPRFGGDQGGLYSSVLCVRL